MTRDDTKFLPNLTAACKRVSEQGTDIKCTDFADLCDSILPFFDHLGTLFGFARAELAEKAGTVRQAGQQHGTLAEMVKADKAAKRVTVKNSNSRNLHRLMTSITFVRLLLSSLLAHGSSVTLRQAATEAYDQSLGLFHTFVVRAAIKAGLFSLPSREQFLKGIQETDDSARGHAEEFAQAASGVVREIDKLYDEPMPSSDVWCVPTGQTAAPRTAARTAA